MYMYLTLAQPYSQIGLFSNSTGNNYMYTVHVYMCLVIIIQYYSIIRTIRPPKTLNNKEGSKYSKYQELNTYIVCHTTSGFIYMYSVVHLIRISGEHKLSLIYQTFWIMRFHFKRHGLPSRRSIWYWACSEVWTTQQQFLSPFFPGPARSII